MKEKLLKAWYHLSPSICTCGERLAGNLLEKGFPSKSHLNHKRGIHHLLLRLPSDPSTCRTMKGNWRYASPQPSWWGYHGYLSNEVPFPYQKWEHYMTPSGNKNSKLLCNEGRGKISKNDLMGDEDWWLILKRNNSKSKNSDAIAIGDNLCWWVRFVSCWVKGIWLYELTQTQPKHIYC